MGLGAVALKYIATPGVYVDVRSETRPEIVHHVWTGEPLTGSRARDVLPDIAWLTAPHCTCDNFKWETRVVGVQYMCKHIKLVIYGEGAVGVRGGTSAE